MTDTHILIPARYGSKGLPFKNRMLFSATADTIPDGDKHRVTVSTDDDLIIEAAKSYGFKVHHRSAELSGDNVSMRDVVADYIRKHDVMPEDFIVLLYLTYPERTYLDVSTALNFYYKKCLEDEQCDSMLCKQPVKSNPFLCMYELDGHKGKQIIEHDLYRRQDYPECFELSHYICIFRARNLQRLNKNMYNESTVFYPINKNVIDVDTVNDLNKINKND